MSERVCGCGPKNVCVFGCGCAGTIQVNTNNVICCGGTGLPAAEAGSPGGVDVGQQPGVGVQREGHLPPEVWWSHQGAAQAGGEEEEGFGRAAV